MITDPAALAFTISAVLVAGVAVGAILAGLAQRGRAADDAERAGRAFRELRDLAQACCDPVHLVRLMRGTADIWDNWRPDGLALDVAAPPPLTPAYAHRLVDAYATGDPVDFAGCWVPPDIQGRVRAIVAGASEPTVRISTLGQPGSRRPWLFDPAADTTVPSCLITAPTPPLAGDARLVRPRTSDG
ncbi:hypothetical protein ACGFI9_12265 [Micromonospora sp. NPDC048930]|uniref:hypothetical protein n=1 Tax=Micromonospora sp. NPDC048930 TaxID=3364261 RepID=UPI00371AB063